MSEPTNRKRSYATIRDVAAKAQAGKTSISRYLNGEFHLLSDDLRQRIESAIQELEYRPNQMARSLKYGRTRLIGLIIADISNPFSVEVLKGVEAESIKQGFMTVVCNARNSIELECEFLNLLNGYRVDGLIINSAGINTHFLQALKATTLPFVLLDRKIDDFPCDMVGLDNPQAAQLATNHLIEQGFEAKKKGMRIALAEPNLRQICCEGRASDQPMTPTHNGKNNNNAGTQSDCQLPGGT